MSDEEEILFDDIYEVVTIMMIRRTMMMTVLIMVMMMMTVLIMVMMMTMAMLMMEFQIP